MAVASSGVNGAQVGGWAREWVAGLVGGNGSSGLVGGLVGVWFRADEKAESAPLLTWLLRPEAMKLN